MTIKENSKKSGQSLTTLEEQKKLEHLLDEFFLYIEKAAEFDALKVEPIYKKDSIYYSLRISAMELRNLVYNLINSRVNLFIEHTGFDEDETRKEILLQFLVKFLNENPTEEVVAFFNNPFNIAYLKLIGKQYLLEQKNIKIFPLDAAIYKITFDEEWKAFKNNSDKLIESYEDILEQLFRDLTFDFAKKEKEDNYISDYMSVLYGILEAKYREEYQKVVYNLYKMIRKNSIETSAVSSANKEIIPTSEAYKMALEVCNAQIKYISYLLKNIFNRSSNSFDLAKINIHKMLADNLSKKLNIPTFASLIGREKLSGGELKIIEEKTNDYEIENYDEASAVLLGLNKKPNCK